MSAFSDGDWHFFLLFLAFWTAICLGMAHLGWAKLARCYRASESFDGKRRFFRTAEVGQSSYRNCLTTGVSPRALHLSVLFPFRVGHPPLQIPWEDISASDIRWLLGRGYELRFRLAPHVTIRLSSQLGDALQSEAGLRWPVVAGGGSTTSLNR
jgi:hypothetical protein